MHSVTSCGMAFSSHLHPACSRQKLASIAELPHLLIESLAGDSHSAVRVVIQMQLNITIM